MNTQQAEAVTRLWQMAYMPIVHNRRIDGSVGVSIVRKLGTGRLMLTVTLDGNIRAPYTQDRSMRTHHSPTPQSRSTRRTQAHNHTRKGSDT